MSGLDLKRGAARNHSCARWWPTKENPAAPAEALVEMFEPEGDKRDMRHPNDVDRKRIERALERRARYRYVTPSVCVSGDGYRIESPCCSRRIRRDGGVIDIASLQYIEGPLCWHLYRKDHEREAWQLHLAFQSLQEALRELVADRDHVFWP